MTYGKAISTLESEMQETVEASVMLEAIDKILSMKTINATSKDSLMNAVRFLRNQVNELLKEQEPKPVLSPHIDRFCMRGFAEYIAYCPNCKQEILEKNNKSYCGFCGQAVKWDADISR